MSRTFIYFILLILSFIASNCSFPNEREDCFGGPRLVNAFPDTLTLVLRDESYRYDLEDPTMPVFEHTEGGALLFFASSGDMMIARVDIVPGNTLAITTVKPGVVELFVRATDTCDIIESQKFLLSVIE